MSIDRDALRRLLYRSDEDGRVQSLDAIPDLLDELDAKDRRIAELLATIVRLTNETPFPDEIKSWEFQRAKMLTEIGTLRSRVAEIQTLNAAGSRAVDVMDDIGEQAREKIADIELRLSIATELNVNDRKRIAELEGALRHCDALAFTGRQTAVARGDDDGSKRRAFFRDISDTARAVLPSEKT